MTPSLNAWSALVRCRLPVPLVSVLMQNTAHRSSFGSNQVTVVPHGPIHYCGNRITETFGAERRRREFFDRSHFRTHAQLRAHLESSRARVPCIARCECSPATVQRPAAQAKYLKCCLAAYGPHCTRPVPSHKAPTTNSSSKRIEPTRGGGILYTVPSLLDSSRPVLLTSFSFPIEPPPKPNFVGPLNRRRLYRKSRVRCFATTPKTRTGSGSKVYNTGSIFLCNERCLRCSCCWWLPGASVSALSSLRADGIVQHPNIVDTTASQRRRSCEVAGRIVTLPDIVEMLLKGTLPPCRDSNSHSMCA